MSKKAEEVALKAFPVDKVPYYGLACGAVSESDANLDKRCIFKMGYEQAEKDLAVLPDNQFRDLVRRMREAQREYFKTRSHFVLQRSKELERQVDAELKADERPAPKQPTLFDG